jgi:hypothetical protein
LAVAYGVPSLLWPANDSAVQVETAEPDVLERELLELRSR